MMETEPLTRTERSQRSDIHYKYVRGQLWLEMGLFCSVGPMGMTRTGHLVRTVDSQRKLTVEHSLEPPGQQGASQEELVVL